MAPTGRQSLVAAPWRGTGRRVLVPLCGKTPDLLWLAEQGNEIVGVELSEIAVHPDEMLGYWPELVRIGSHDDLPNGPQNFREAGLTKMIEVVWRSTRDR